ncbi:MAG: radical SAM protein [Myxococcota bacterium]|nr:radical SAM protein [Myxococcota bacterium]
MRASGDPKTDPFANLLVEDPNIRILTVALNYDCNSKCRFCFIEQEIAMKLAPVSSAFIKRVFKENRRRQLFDQIIFSGAECTLRKDLPDIAAAAIREGGFQSVKIQTNGRRLSNKRYLWKLLAAGISEFFVSVHAGTPETDLYLTRSAKSFTEMQQGLRNLKAVGAKRISNTVISEGSYPYLEETARFLIEEDVPECHFWSFIEFGDVSQGGEHADYSLVQPHLKAAISRLKQAGKKVQVSWYPVCLLEEHADVAWNHRSNTLIHHEFRTRAQESGRFSCPEQSNCAVFGKSCVGFHERYCSTVGIDRDVVRPFTKAPHDLLRRDAEMDFMER